MDGGRKSDDSDELRIPHSIPLAEMLRRIGRISAAT
jgi:hypothetical protein